MTPAKKAAKKTTQKNASGKPDMDWFIDGRLGLFIHWGIYALPARHEWVKSKEQITTEDYQKYFDHFYPDMYDPAEWARAAKQAGMKYFCITTKHHDGFCLWDTKQTDYKATKTPWGKDLIKPMVEAFRAEGIKVGFYHSLIDWHHPDFLVDRYHPLRENEAEVKKNAKRDQKKYAAYLHKQVRELLTNYGKIDYIFYDFSYPGDFGKGRDDWNSMELLKLTRELQPGIVINDRLDLGEVPGGWDVKTPEQCMVREPVKVDGKEVPWETCQTFSGSWGYYRDEYSWKSVRQLLTMLIETVSKNGNLLLNVGPTARGNFDARAMDRLEGMGKWMQLHGRSIYGCGPAPEEFPKPDNCFLTYNKKLNRMYVHLLDWRFRQIELPGFAGKVEYAQLLNDGSEISMQGGHQAWMKQGEESGVLDLGLPVRQPDVEIPVIELFMKQ
ncbi:MAG: alpha-L-fucosidase [Candidatus Sumerlaeia bacterium]